MLDIEGENKPIIFLGDMNTALYEHEVSYKSGQTSYENKTFSNFLKEF